MASEQEEGPIDGNAQLWCAVIEQAFIDAGSKRTSKAAEHDRRKARAWLLGGNADFKTVCHLAGMDPDAVHERARAMFDDAPGVVEKLSERPRTGVITSAQERV